MPHTLVTRLHSDPFHLLVEAVEEYGIIFLDPAGQIASWNAGAARITGYPSAEVVGRPVTMLCGQEEADCPADHDDLQVALREGRSEGERVFVRKGGDRFRAAFGVTALHKEGRNIGYAVTFRDVTSQRWAEDDFARTAGLLRAVADGTTDAVFVKDRDGKYLLFNEAASRFVGKPVAEVLGKDDTELFDPISARRLMDRDRRVMATGVTEMAEEVLTAAGVTRTYLASKAPYRDAAGTVIGLIGISRDITDRKRAEEALRDSEQRFRTFVDHATDAFFLHDDRGVILDVNRQACESLGYTRDELVGKTPLDINPDVTPARLEEIAKKLDAGELLTLDRRHRRKDGSIFPVEVRIRPFWVSGCRFSVALVRDITDRKRTEDALRRSEESLRRAQAIGHIGSWTFEVQDGVVLGSEEGYRMCGWGPGPHRAEELLAIVHPDDLPRMQAAWQASLSGALFEIEHRLVVGGQVIWVSVRAEPEVDANGRVVRITGVTQNITERRRLEELFRQSQKMEAVGLLAGGVAHDFNNLLTVINGFSEMLLATLSPFDPRLEGMVAIRDAGERAARLTGQLLAFGRKAMVEPKILDLNVVIDSTGQMLRRLIGEDITLTTVLRAGLSPVRIDPGQVEQVLLNLAVNARDAMPRGGRLTVETADVEVREGDLPGYPDLKPGRHVRLVVSDTGCGMTDEVKSRIFEPFFTTKGVGKGTGLGLATVYGIVKQAGGHVAVDSRVQVGTTFTVLLPVVAGAVAPTGSGEIRVAARGTETVLIAEDEDGVRRLIRMALEMYGYTVLEAGAGADAVRTVDTHPGPVDLLVTDVVMPDLGGRDLADAVRTRRPGVKVLYVSGYTDDAVVRHGVEAATDAFLQKPFTPLTLARKVRAVLDGTP